MSKLFADRPAQAPRRAFTAEHPFVPPKIGEFQRCLKRPATALLFVSASTVAHRAADLIYTRYYFEGNLKPALDPNLLHFAAVASAIILVANLIVLYGSFAMLTMRSRRLARIAAIVSMIPILSPWLVLGMPFGFWALAILNKPQCAAEFKN